jgi:hypothetical protein
MRTIFRAAVFPDKDLAAFDFEVVIFRAPDDFAVDDHALVAGCHCWKGVS